MKLYHGTAEKHLNAILARGLKPRGKRKGNWDAYPSHPGAVYLTNGYALHYAQSATSGKEERLAVIEIDTDKLLPWRFAPDEDFMEQASRNHPEFANIKGWSLAKRCAYFRRHSLRYSGNWSMSIEHMGNCCYHGTIPPHAMTRIVTLPRDGKLAWASDPTITLLNYRILGGYYRNLMRHLFGDELDPSDNESNKSLHQFEPERCPRDGVEVRNLIHTRAA